MTNGHWHLNSKDVAVNEKIFVGMGGKAFQAGGRHRVLFPGVMIILDGAPGSPPPTGPTQGSVVNHVGFVVNNVQERVAQWKAAGVPVEPGNNGRLDQAYVNTPDGLRIEILENKSQTMPIQSEHVHFFLPEATIPESQAWYGKIFGAKANTRNNAPVADIPGVQLRFNKADSAQAPTKGRVLDHIGFDVKDLKSLHQDAGRQQHQARSAVFGQSIRHWNCVHHRPVGDLYRDQRAAADPLMMRGPLFGCCRLRGAETWRAGRRRARRSLLRARQLR